MTCLADASFLGVVVDDLRQPASYRLRPAAHPPLPACIHALHLPGRPAGREHAPEGHFFQRDNLPPAVISV
uniref:Uncharacterized protein n=1 Tax=Setaria italica TaxID=4555 RepID=K4ANB3_SETIT